MSEIRPDERRAERVLRFHSVLVELAKLDNPDVEAALSDVTQIASDTLGVARTSVWMFNEDRSTLTCKVLYDQSRGFDRSGVTLAAPDFPGYFAALESSRVIAADDAHTRPETREFSEVYLKPLGITSMLDVPIWWHGKTVGVLCHEHVGPMRAWKHEEQDFAASVADMISLSLEGAGRRRAESALRESETRFRALFEQFPLSIQIFAPDGRTLQVNRAWEQLFGLTLEDVANFNLRHDPQLNAIMPFLERGFRGEAVSIPAVRYDARHLSAQARLDGSRWIEAFVCPVKDHAGSIIEIIVVHRDVTERRNAESEVQQAREELERRVRERTMELAEANLALLEQVEDRKAAEAAVKRSEEHFRSMIENATDITTIILADGTLAYQSPSVERILGYTPEELVGRNCFEFIHPEDARETGERIRFVFENPGSVRTSEFRFRRKNGSWCFLEGVGKTLLGDSPAEGIVVNSRDISERKRADEVMRSAHETADRANRAKSEFLSRMSHELRTPMNSILGFAQVLTRKQLPPDQRKSVDHILKAGRHLLELINEVLDISRIEANRMQLSTEPVRIAQVIPETLSLLAPLAAQRDCTVTEEVSKECDYFVSADRQRLVQVLLNLVANAIKYNRRGGSVKLTCGPEGEGRLRINVIDTGPGIEAAKMPLLFSPFERLGADQSEVEGTGLGLALSKRLVEAMGGEMGVESTVGEGSTFWLALDMAESPRDRHEREHEGRKPRLPQIHQRCTLLYIEDNLANLTLIETILADRPGITLYSALQGLMGLDLAVKHLPDLILLDLHLPDITGDEVLDRLKHDPRTRDIPVVVISADATPSHKEKILKLDAAAYLTKPLDVPRLLETLDKILKARRS